MKINKFLIAALVLATSFTACKNDKEEDIKIEKSSTDGLFINEVYTSNPDWIELYNSTDKEIDLSGFRLEDKKGEKPFTIPKNTKIVAKGFIVFNQAPKNEEGTNDQFPFGISSSKGDIVKLFDANSKLIDEIAVPVIENKESYGRVTDGAKEWKKFEKPTEGISNSSTVEVNEIIEVPEPKSKLKLYINEVMSAPNKDSEIKEDFIELYNGEESEINIGGFLLYDDGGTDKGFTIPENTIIPSKGFIVYSEVKKKDNVLGFTFGLAAKGEKVTLLNKEGEIIDQIDTPDFKKKKGQSYARKGDGGSEWEIVDAPTPGKTNGSTN